MTTVGSGHLSYYQALEQGFQGCLETTRADLGSGPPVCWVRQTGYVTAEPAPARRSSPRPTQPNQRRYEALRASVLRGADQRRGPGRGRIRCMEIGANGLDGPLCIRRSQRAVGTARPPAPLAPLHRSADHPDQPVLAGAGERVRRAGFEPDAGVRGTSAPAARPTRGQGWTGERTASI